MGDSTRDKIHPAGVSVLPVLTMVARRSSWVSLADCDRLRFGWGIIANIDTPLPATPPDVPLASNGATEEAIEVV